MTFEGGKDYSFLLNAPAQFEAFLGAFQMRLPSGQVIAPTLDHPVYGAPEPRLIVAAMARRDGPQLLQQTLLKREEAIYWMKQDPLRHGYEPGLQDTRRACWKDARELLKRFKVLFITTRNQNTKSEFAGKEVVLQALAGEAKRIWVMCETNNTSIRAGGQQELIWKYLPPEWKQLKGMRGKAIDFALNYSPKDKFAGNATVLPNKTEMQFMNFAQDIGVLEGPGIDFYWGDELMPVEWVLTLFARLTARRGKGLVTFTPIRGWNETYALFMQGGKVVETQDFPLFPDRQHWPGLPKGKIPYIVESMKENCAAMIFPPDSNPFVPFENLVSDYKDSAYEMQMQRLAGIATKKMGNPFPKFGKWHIIPADAIPKNGTNYQIIDFQGRNWFMLWIRVVRTGGRQVHYVYREWPDKKTHGEWALPSSRPQGTRGPAQETIQLGYREYRDLMLQHEGWTSAELKTFEAGGPAPRKEIEALFRRLGDPRSGKAPVQTADEGGTCNFDELSALGLEVEAAMGVMIGEGLGRIRDLLNFNEEQFEAEGRRFTPLNSPALFFSEECENTTDCLRFYTERCPEKDNAAKDPIDCLRYMATEDLEDMSGVKFECVRRGSY